MNHRILYQTLEDRNNPDDIEEHGAYLCSRKDAWLGTGYYFWDTFKELAHWWGEKSYKSIGKDYIICETACDANLDGVYDLVGKPELFFDIGKAAKIICKNRNRDNIFFSELMEYLKENTDFCKEYHAIRVFPMRTRLPYYRINFGYKYQAYLDLRPAIQFCFFNKKHFTKPFKIIYPTEYCEGGAM